MKRNQQEFNQNSKSINSWSLLILPFWRLAMVKISLINFSLPIGDFDSILTSIFNWGKKWTRIWLVFDVDFESKIDRLMTHFQEWDLDADFSDRISIRRPWSSTKQFSILSIEPTSFRRWFRVESDSVKSIVLHWRPQMVLVAKCKQGERSDSSEFL